jgi:D-arabinose 1-dehydrogenase-like Zn-dependent alcohol dehydrogenase
MKTRSENGFMPAAAVPRPGGEWEVRDIQVPFCEQNQVLVKVRASVMRFTDIEQTRGDHHGEA